MVVGQFWKCGGRIKQIGYAERRIKPPKILLNSKHLRLYQCSVLTDMKTYEAAFFLVFIFGPFYDSFSQNTEYIYDTKASLYCTQYN